MKYHIIPVRFSLFVVALSLLSTILCSFGWENQVAPPAERSTQTAAKQRRIQRLQQRADRTRSVEKKHRLNHKIKQLQQTGTQTKEADPAWSIVGFSFALMGGILLVAGSVFIIPAFALFIIIGGLFLTIGMGLCLAMLILIHHHPDRFSGRGFALAGLIIGGVFLLARLVFISFPIPLILL